MTDEVRADESGTTGHEKSHGGWIVATATGALFGIGIGLLVSDRRVWPLVSLPILGSLLFVAIRALVPAAQRRRVGAIVAVGFALHVALAVALYDGSLALGLGGFISGDDYEYASLANAFVLYTRGQLDPALGPPYWSGELYLFGASGTWVYLESAIFFLTGFEPLVPILLNGVFALATALLLYDMTRRLFNERAAMIALSLTMLFPSLVLWSSLNLKEAITIFILAVALWALMQFQRTPRWRWLTVALLMLIPLQNVRGYMAVGLAALIPIVVGIAPGLLRPDRIRWSAITIVASALFMNLSPSGIGLGPRLLESFEAVRAGMAVGARTAYVPPPPVVVYEGDTFVVPTLTPAPGLPSPSPAGSATAPIQGSPPSPSPQVVHVDPQTRIVVVTGSPGPSPFTGAVAVHPGDIVVVGPADRTPAPTEARRTLDIQTPAPGVAVVNGVSGAVLTSDPATQSADALVRRTIEDVPIGAAFSLFGPFPWLLTRRIDLGVLPEMVLWYVVLAAAVVTVVRERRSWRTLGALVLLAAGLLGLFSLVEGNWGTLLRHRSLAIPWVIVLAAPALSRVPLAVLRRS